MKFRLLLTLSSLTCKSGLILIFKDNSFCKVILASEWNYEGHGPDYWVHKYPTCAGRLQSPINIQEPKAIYNSKLGHISFHNYERLLTWNISNNGHTSLIL